MSTHESRIEPPAELLAAARRWIEPVRTALGPEFLSAYLTGSVLTHGFDAARSRVNLLIVARSLEPDALDRVAASVPESKKGPPPLPGSGPIPLSPPAVISSAPSLAAPPPVPSGLK